MHLTRIKYINKSRKLTIISKLKLLYKNQFHSIGFKSFFLNCLFKIFFSEVKFCTYIHVHICLVWVHFYDIL